mgnify:CR=1 FL=1
MLSTSKAIIFLGLLLTSCVFADSMPKYVTLQTNKGEITLELYAEKAPETVKNFVSYIKAGHYDNTIFHRVIDGFVAQGGGFTSSFVQKPTEKPIANEAANGLTNNEYTVAMARTSDPNSATSQFFINLANNDFLNYNNNQAGYAVFAKVISGHEVVADIANTPTHTQHGMADVPVNEITIIKANLKG